MPINMTDYRMIINERVYNVLQIMIDFTGPVEDGKPPKPKFIDAVYIDEDGTIKTIRDEAWCFQFVRRNGGAADGKTNKYHGGKGNDARKRMQVLRILRKLRKAGKIHEVYGLQRAAAGSRQTES